LPAIFPGSVVCFYYILDFLHGIKCSRKDAKAQGIIKTTFSIFSLRLSAFARLFKNTTLYANDFALRRAGRRKSCWRLPECS
jgi:hypothetical protein